MAFSVERVDHVGIAVADLDSAITFYTEKFGLTLIQLEDNVEQGVREAMLAPISTINETSHPATRGYSPPTLLQLLAPLTPESAIARFLNRRGEGVQHVALTVTDIDNASQQLREQGLQLLFETARRGTANSRINFVHPNDAGGVLLELVEPSRTIHIEH